ncbi:SCAR-like protein 2 isoform X2 [Macadamia integrifolia]|uniref:SCAR-like protein 2 isoform X2 n=1 Tax=Macadamia integrifolia TaxID=60698 RepID=UPI001C5331FD|nr:SCAR-like protein 2 isoform X2 [Macadamia integrifolia]
MAWVLQSYTEQLIVKIRRLFLMELQSQDSSGFYGSWVILLSSDWHRKMRTEKNHLIYSDLPKFLVESYEECRDPPHLHLLDKFDTGGSGACMKRYSDPSFFGRVLASSATTDVDKVKREKKARKTKKRGSRRKNGEISRMGSIACHRRGMQSMSLNIHGQSSTTQNVPLCDVRSKSELQERSMSFDSSSRMLFASPKINEQVSDAETVSLFDVRSNSELQDLSPFFYPRSKMDCIESIFDGSSSIRTEKQETNELVTSRLKTESTETLGSVLPDKLNETVDDDLTHGSLQEQGAPNSSSVTWDEKTEIIKSEFQQHDDDDDQYEASELHTVSSRISKLGNEASSLSYADSDDILFIDENIPASVTVGNQFDEIESEIENYMDALNTMESEVETDFECQTKREVDYASFNFEDTDVECVAGEMVKMIGQNSDSSDTEPCLPSYSSSNKEMSQISNKLIAVESFPTPEGPGRVNFCENNDILNDSIENGFESVNSDLSLSGMPNSHAPFSDKIESSLSKSQESDIETSSTSSMPNSHAPFSDKTESFLSKSQESDIETSTTSPMPNSHAPFSDKTESFLSKSQESDIETSSTSPMPNSHAPFSDKIESSLFKSQESDIGTSSTSPMPSSHAPFSDKIESSLSKAQESDIGTSSTSPMPSSHAPLSDKIESSLSKSQESDIETSIETSSTSPMPNSHAPLSDKIESSLFKSQESDIGTSSTSPMPNSHAPFSDKIESSLSKSQELDIGSSSTSPMPSSHAPLSDKIESSLSKSQESDIGSSSTSPMPNSHAPFSDKIESSLNKAQESDIETSSTSPMPNSHAPLSDKIESSLSKSQELDIETSSTSPIQFWTNGGLLGLEPSKPPDYRLPNAPSQSSLADSKDGSNDVSRNCVVPRSRSDESVGKLGKKLDSVGGKLRSSDSISPAEDHLVRNVENMIQTIDQSQCSTLCNDKKNDCGSRNELHFESSVLETNIEKPEVSCNISSHAPELPVVPVVKTPFDEAGQENTESSSNMFDLGHRLLVNGFRRKASLHEERSEPASSVKMSPVMLHESLRNEQMKGKARVEHQTSLETTPKEQTDCESPENSPSSPPLEHMNISFHSINGFETSKMKLKFPDGHHFHESIRHVIFPSFQLLPEPSTQQDIDSESDDDTFYRSSPCTSEDRLRHHSESSSEQWESGDSTGSEDNELHDALRRISSDESISGSLEHFHSGPSLDLPSFDALDPLMDQHESVSISVPKVLLELQLQYRNEPLAPQPSLPPLQWRTVKPHLDAVEDKQGAISDVMDHPNHQLVPGSTNCQNPIPGPPKQPHFKEAAEFPVNDKELNEQREASQAANEKEVDEREDIMYQIRTKQFNLKRTMPTRQSLTPDAPTNVKVAAILEKANAIRQACVGSDEGVDENWSDG